MRAIFQVRGLFQVGSALVLHLLCQPGWDAAAYWVPGVHLVQSRGGGGLHQPSCHFNSSGKGDGLREGRGKCPLEGGPGNCFQVTRLGFLRVAIRNRAWKATKYHSDDESRPPKQEYEHLSPAFTSRVDLEDRCNRSSTG